MASRGISDLLGAVLHMQYNGRYVQQTEFALSARSGRIPSNNLVRLHEQFCESSYLHHIQSGI